MLDYKSACQKYEPTNSYYRVREDYLGYKLNRYEYMKYDPEQDRFIVSYVGSTYGYIKDPTPSNKDNHQYKRLHKSQWIMVPYAYIYPDRIEIPAPVPAARLWMFNIGYVKSRTIKLSGYTWYLPGKKDMQGDFPLTIKQDGSISLAPPKMRVTCSERRKEMNNLIKKIRNLLKIRIKLGAFAGLTPGNLESEARARGVPHRWQISASEFMGMMNAIVEDDIKSFYPLLWLAQSYGYYSYLTQNDKIDWVKKFKNYSDSMRETMRKEMNVVSYEPIPPDKVKELMGL